MLPLVTVWADKWQSLWYNSRAIISTTIVQVLKIEKENQKDNENMLDVLTMKFSNGLGTWSRQFWLSCKNVHSLILYYTEYCVEDLPRATGDRGGCWESERERVREALALHTNW